MSSRLDRIEAWAKFALKNDGPEDKFEVVLALVNVAKAAEEAARLSRPTEAQMHALREALAVLDEKAGGK